MTQPYPFNLPEGLVLAEEYARAQCTPGLVRVKLPFGEPAWLATRHADARMVLSDSRFSRAMAGERDAPRSTPMNPVGIVAMDAPEHTRLRRLAAQAFTAARVRVLRPRVRELAEQAVHRMRELGAPADLVAHFALTLPIEVICELLGVPATDRELFRGWSEAVLATGSGERFQRATAELMAYMGELVQARRRQPAEDLISGLAQAGEDDDRLSTVELVQLCVALLLGGFETTAAQIANFTHTLLDRPGEYARLRADPASLESTVEELLRLVPMPASAAMPRYAVEDLCVGEHTVRAGEAVLVALSAANRDPLRYPEPDQLQPDRPARGHLTFGHGSHFCPGAALARVELQEALSALIRLLPGLRPAGAVTWKTGAFLRGPQTLPVAW